VTSRNATFYESGVSGALLAPLRWVFYVLMMLLALIFAAWVVDWVFVFRVWPNDLARLQAILSEDLARTARLGNEYYDVTQFAMRTANVLYEGIFGITGIHDMGSRFADASALSIPDTIMRNTYVSNYQAIQVAMIGTQLFGVRLAVLLAVSPLLVLSYAAAMTDGLVQRAIRRAGGGNESANIYHRAKYFLVALMASISTLCLLLPVSIDLHWILLPGATLLVLLARYQWTYYKKHL
jgi:integrating conjugative element membrane protein (TIGR03747 family)